MGGSRVPNLLSANSHPDLPFPTQDFCLCSGTVGSGFFLQPPESPWREQNYDIPIEETSCMEAEWHGTMELKLSWSLNYQAVRAPTAGQVEIACQMVAAHLQ